MHIGTGRSSGLSSFFLGVKTSKGLAIGRFCNVANKAARSVPRGRQLHTVNEMALQELTNTDCERPRL